MRIKCHYFIFVFFLFAINGLQATPQVNSVSPYYGPNTGGTSVTIKGSGFLSASAVNFGKNPAASFTITSDSEIIAVSPTYSPGTVDIQVVAGSGASPVTPSDRFTFQGPWLLIDSAGGNYDITNLGTLVTDSFNNPGTGACVSITPDGTQAVVTSDSSITVSGEIDSFDLTSIPFNLTTIQSFNNDTLSGVSITPNGTEAYVGSTQNLIKIDLPKTLATSPTFSTGGVRYAAIAQDGNIAYCATGNTHDILMVDLLSGNSTIYKTTTYETLGIALSPDGNLLIVTTGNGSISYVYVYYLSDPGMTPTQFTYSTGSATFFVAISPNGQIALVSDELANKIYVYDLTTTPVTQINTLTSLTLNGPLGIAFDPSGSKAYVANFNTDTISILDIATFTFDDNTIRCSNNPFNLAVTPDQAPVAHFTCSGNGKTITLDATGSISPTGSIKTYSWDFGDGNTETTSNPVVKHTYSVGGAFTVTLVVTNTAGTSLNQTFTGLIVSNNGGPTAMISEQIVIGPENARGKQIANKFLTQTDLVNVLKWNIASGTPPTTFNIYRDAALTVLVGSVPGNVDEFKDHNRKKGKTYTYYIVAVYPGGIVSQPSIVEVKPLRRKR